MNLKTDYKQITNMMREWAKRCAEQEPIVEQDGSLTYDLDGSGGHTLNLKPPRIQDVEFFYTLIKTLYDIE